MDIEVANLHLSFITFNHPLPEYLLRRILAYDKLVFHICIALSRDKPYVSNFRIF